MKLDKIKFAMLISKIADMANRTIDHNEIVDIDNLTEINVEPVAISYAPVEAVDELLKQFNASGGIIPAIKAYRALTGAGLKESKDAVERYRMVPRPVAPKDATLGDILEVLKEMAFNC